MIPTILVPIDSSREHESPLPCAAAIAEGARGRLLLLPTQDGAELSQHTAAAINGLRERGLPVEVVTSSMAPARAITRTVRLRNVDLVVMSPHLGGGLRGWGWHHPGRLGPLADAAVRRCPAPVLLVGQGTPVPLGVGSRRPARAVVLLDGSPECEGVLPALQKLRGWLPLSVHLLGLPRSVDVDQIRQITAQMRVLATSIADDGVEVEMHAVPTGDPAMAACSLFDQGVADLLVLPVEGDWPAETGSLAPLTAAVLDAVHQPVLLIRVEPFVPLGSIAGCLHV